MLWSTRARVQTPGPHPQGGKLYEQWNRIGRSVSLSPSTRPPSLWISVLYAIKKQINKKTIWKLGGRKDCGTQCLPCAAPGSMARCLSMSNSCPSTVSLEIRFPLCPNHPAHHESSQRAGEWACNHLIPTLRTTPPIGSSHWHRRKDSDHPTVSLP